MTEYKLVTILNFHEIIPKYIDDNKIIISEYDDMSETILRMMRAKYCFNMDKNLLRGFLEDLTYMYSPNDDKNKDRIINMLEESDSDDDDCPACDGDSAGMQSMMNMLMQGGGQRAAPDVSESGGGQRPNRTEPDVSDASTQTQS
jgi:hypothetical protein